MTSYRVRWEIDVEADSPAEAACKARVFATKEETTATRYEVLAEVPPSGPFDGIYDGGPIFALVEEFDVRWEPSFPYTKAYTIAEAEALDDAEEEED